MMEGLTIDISKCKTALQFLDTVGKALGKPLGTFSILNHHLLTYYHPQITFAGMKEFSARCPHATKEVEMILKRVQGHYGKEGKGFEYSLQP